MAETAPRPWESLAGGGVGDAPTLSSPRLPAGAPRGSNVSVVETVAFGVQGAQCSKEAIGQTPHSPHTLPVGDTRPRHPYAGSPPTSRACSAAARPRPRRWLTRVQALSAQAGASEGQAQGRAAMGRAARLRVGERAAACGARGRGRQPRGGASASARVGAEVRDMAAQWVELRAPGHTLCASRKVAQVRISVGSGAASRRAAQGS